MKAIKIIKDTDGEVMAEIDWYGAMPDENDLIEFLSEQYAKSYIVIEDQLV